MNRSLLALTAGMLLLGNPAARAQTQSPNLNDDTQMLLTQICPERHEPWVPSPVQPTTAF